MKKLLLILATAAISYGSFAAGTRTERLLAEMKNPKSKYVFVAAHRGDWRNWPENSLEAVQSAIDMGVDIVEIDVAMTRDSVLIVMHDRRVNRTTKAKGLVSDFDYAELSKYRLKSGHGVTTACKIPTLEEMLLLCRDKAIVNIDSNGWPYFDRIYELLERTGTLDQVIIKCGADVDRARKVIKGRKVMFMPIICPNSERSVATLKRYLAEYPCIAYEVCMYKTVGQSETDCIRDIIAHGSHVWTDTLWDSVSGGYSDDAAVKDPDKIYGKHLELGATMIQTDRPATLISYLKSKGRRKLKK